jgi:hypothetical protein
MKSDTGNGLITVLSGHSVDQTVASLSMLLDAKGINFSL